MEKIKTCIKRHRVLAAVLVVVGIGYLWYTMPFKVTDPNDPRFVPELFRMRDYASYEGVRELQTKVFPKLFPIGTPKSYVDKMMIDRGGATINDQSDLDKGDFSYDFMPLNMYGDSLMMKVFYNCNYKVIALWFAGKWIAGDGYKPETIPYKKGHKSPHELIGCEEGSSK